MQLQCKCMQLRPPLFIKMRLLDDPFAEIKIWIIQFGSICTLKLCRIFVVVS